MTRDDALREMLHEAVDTLRTLGRPIEDLLDLDGIADGERSSAIAHALGVLEGAGVALGLTQLELLDEHDLLREPESAMIAG